MEQVEAILIATVAVLFWIAPGVLLANIIFRRNTYRWDDNRLLPIALCYTLVLCWPVALLVLCLSPLFPPLLHFWQSRQYSDNDEKIWYRSAYKRVVSWFRGTVSRERVPPAVPPADVESQDRAELRLQMRHTSNDAVQRWNPRATTTITDKSQNTNQFLYTQDGDLEGRTGDIKIAQPPTYAAVASNQVPLVLILPPSIPPPPPFILPSPTSPVTPVSARCNA